jgi:hypothetical protein
MDRTNAIILIQVNGTGWEMTIMEMESDDRKYKFAGQDYEMETLLQTICDLQLKDKHYRIHVEGYRRIVANALYDKCVELQQECTHITDVMLFPLVEAELVISDTQWELVFISNRRKGRMTNAVVSPPSLVLLPILQTITVFGSLKLTVRGASKSYLDMLKKCIDENDRILLVE